MAVTVPQASPYIVFDDKDCIVEVGDLAMPEFGSFLGQSVWSCFPDLRSLYERHYARAIRRRSFTRRGRP